MRRLLPFYVMTAVSLLGVAPLLGQGRGQGPGGQRPLPEVSQAVMHDVSRPLRNIQPVPPFSSRQDFEVRRTPGAPGQGQTDAVTQTLAVAPLQATPITSFDGVGQGAPFPFTVQYAPPDTVGEAGKTQYVQWVNTSFAVFDKATGVKLYGPAAGNTIWSGFGGDCSTRNDGDPIVQYDQLADRWIMTQFSVRSGNYLQCVAVSTSDDATGTWNRYAFSYPYFPDYPKLGVWPDAYYITFNMFSGIFVGNRVCAYDRAAMIAGTAATQVCFQTSLPSLLPSDLEGKTLPPAGTPNYILGLRTTTSLNFLKFHVDFATPANSTLSGPTTVPVSSFSTACGGGTCIPQQGTSNQLDSLGERLMYRLSYRNLGSNHEALVVNHSVATGGVTGVRWYEIDVQGGTPSVQQQSTYAPGDGLYRWMGSAAMDHVGNIAVGFSTSSSSTYPAIKIAGRQSGDPVNTLSIAEDMMSGTGSQTSSLHRWGDYSTLSVDPTDDCTLWYTTEYLKTNGSFNWSTRIGSFKFDTCTSTTSPDFSIAASPSSQTVTQGGSTTYNVSLTRSGGFNDAVAFSASNLPSGATASFNPTSTTGNSSVMTVQTTGATPTGPFTVTITGTSGSLVHSTTVALNVQASGSFSVSVSPGSQNVQQGSATSYDVTVAPSGGFNEDVFLEIQSGLPTGASASFSPAVVANANGTSTLGVQTQATTTTGQYILQILGTSTTTSTTYSTSAILNVDQATPSAGDFSLSVSPGTRNVRGGADATYSITISPTGGFSDDVTLSVDGAPSGSTATVSPNPITGGSGSASLTVTTGGVASGSYVLTINAANSDGSVTHSTTVNLRVR